MSRDRFSHPAFRNPAAVKRIILRRLANATFDSPIADAVNLAMDVSFNRELDLPGTDEDMAQAILTDLAELFARASGGSSPAYLQTA